MHLCPLIQSVCQKIRLLHSFSSAIRRTFVQYFARFQLTQRVARSLGDNWASCSCVNTPAAGRVAVARSSSGGVAVHRVKSKKYSIRSGVMLEMEVGRPIRKRAWQRAWRYPAYLWSLRWVYAIKKTRRLVYAVYPHIPPNTPLSIRILLLYDSTQTRTAKIHQNTL